MSMELAKASKTLAGGRCTCAQATMRERPGAKTQVAVTLAAVGRTSALLKDMPESAVHSASLMSLTLKARERVSGIRAIRKIWALFELGPAVGVLCCAELEAIAVIKTASSVKSFFPALRPSLIGFPPASATSGPLCRI